MANPSGGGGSHTSSGGPPTAAAYRAFRLLVESADRKFARVQDLPAHGREQHPHCQRKVFKAYTLVWRFQQEHRRELVEAGMRRWEIGEVASRIGQLYYGQYLRTSDVRFLLEAYVFYEAILSRGYFEFGRGKTAAGSAGEAAAGGKQQMLSDLGVMCKKLRFYARFAVVALLLDRREVVGKLVERLRALVDDCRVAFPVSTTSKLKDFLPVTAGLQLKADYLIDALNFFLVYNGKLFHGDCTSRDWEALFSIGQQVVAATCEELSPDGKSEQTIALQKENHGVRRNVNASSLNCHKRDNALCHGPVLNRDQHDYSGGLDYLYPSDLIPFTRSPLFFIIDSDNSHAFKVVYGQERGETAVLLLSPERSTSQSSFAADLATNQSQFTFFLTSPLQAFCQLVGLSDVDQDTYNNAETILSNALAEWEVILCMSVSLNLVYAQVLSDPFLRRLIVRFIFCRSALSLFHLPKRGSQHLPDCLPDLPDSLSPNSASMQPSILQLADTLGVASNFHFFDSSESSTYRKQY